MVGRAMMALGVHQLVQARLLTGDGVFVLTCYLDDSGKDSQNRVTTIAGYLGRDTAWKAFETEVEPVFDRAKVNVLHATDLEGTRRGFNGWRVLQKQSFVAEACRTLAKHSILGVSMSAVKDTYFRRKLERKAKRTVTPYTFCFQVIIDWLLRDIRTGRAVWSEGLALVLECGHENNPEAEEQFYAIRKLHKLEKVLRSISFVPKDDCRAIQMADLFAYYSRREAVFMEENVRLKRKLHEPETMLKIITERGQFRGFIATDFGSNMPNVSRFFAGPLDGD
jgi:hypothetical protein